MYAVRHLQNLDSVSAAVAWLKYLSMFYYVRAIPSVVMCCCYIAYHSTVFCSHPFHAPCSVLLIFGNN
jgi:hypothetical protein